MTRRASPLFSRMIRLSASALDASVTQDVVASGTTGVEGRGEYVRVTSSAPNETAFFVRGFGERDLGGRGRGFGPTVTGIPYGDANLVRLHARGLPVLLNLARARAPPVGASLGSARGFRRSSLRFFRARLLLRLCRDGGHVEDRREARVTLGHRVGVPRRHAVPPQMSDVHGLFPPRPRARRACRSPTERALHARRLRRRPSCATRRASRSPGSPAASSASASWGPAAWTRRSRSVPGFPLPGGSRSLSGRRARRGFLARIPTLRLEELPAEELRLFLPHRPIVRVRVHVRVVARLHDAHLGVDSERFEDVHGLQRIASGSCAR